MRYDRQLLALDEAQLEQFVRDWVEQKTKEYVHVERFSGAGDMGRDVVGFLTKVRHEGPWHNYQCKQYGRPLQTAAALLELGKVLYYGYCGEFSLPTAYFFVAPRGVNRNFERLIYNPSELKTALLDGWEEYCAKKIIKGRNILLTEDIRGCFEGFDFSTVRSLSVHTMLADSAIKPVLVKWFGIDPGPPPQGVVPADVQDWELPYIKQLVDAYGERDGCSYASHADVTGHPSHGSHLKNQRERFFEADAFKRFYRDNTVPEDLDAFEKDIYYGVIDTHDSEHASALSRLNAVMAQAAAVHPAGTLAKHARVPVKQGVCHHLANEDRLKWRR